MRRATSASAGPITAAVVLATMAAWSCAFAGTLEPEMLPEPLWWRGDNTVPIAQDPLLSTASPSTARLFSEWAPLYDASDGGKLERSRHSLLVTTPWGPWRAGLEIESRSGIARSAEGRTRVGAEEPQAYLQSLAVAHYGRRLQFGGGASQRDGRAGWSLAGRAEIAPAVSFSLGWSQLPERGRAEVRWEDLVVATEGSWDDRRVTWQLAARARPNLTLWLGQQALDRRAVELPGTASEDRLVPALAWRASEAGVGVRGLGAQWIATVGYGEGRQRTSILRRGTAYATATGPVYNGLATLEARPNRLPLAARGWVGRWSGDAGASVALWPFDGLGAVFGTRRVARSALSLDHAGVTLDYAPQRDALTGGLALSRLAPRAGYESWQAPLFGLGHDDASTGETRIRAAWLLGTRVAASFRFLAVRTHLEAVQWIPVRIEREPAAGGASSPPTGGSSNGAGTNARGGTVLRVTIER